MDWLVIISGLDKFKNPENLFKILADFKENKKFAEQDAFIEELISANSITWDFETQKTYINYLRGLAPEIQTQFMTLDCCGTGGDNSGTFNISTAAAIIAAATGIKVAKNGGRSSSSKTGSIDVLEQLGVDLEMNSEQKLLRLEKYNLAFFSSKVSAELLAPIKNYCKKAKSSSFISIIAPFISPINTSFQLIGVGKIEWFDNVVALAREFVKLGYRKKIIVFISESANKPVSYFDELSPLTKSKIIQIDSERELEFYLDTSPNGINPKHIEANNPEESSQIIQKIINPDYTDQATEDARLVTNMNSALIMYLARDLSYNQEDFENKFRSYLQESLNLIKEFHVLNNWQAFLTKV